MRLGMSLEKVIEREGVGALIVRNNSFLTVEEQRYNRRTQKIPGMRSIIYETVDPGESVEQALRRSLGEEVNLNDFISSFSLTDVKLCEVQITPGIWLSAYLIQIDVPDDFVIKGSSEAEDVANPAWDLIYDLLNEPIGSLRFRPGNREILQSYMRYSQGLLLQPDIYFQPQNVIADEVFTRFHPRLNEEGKLH